MIVIVIVYLYFYIPHVIQHWTTSAQKLQHTEMPCIDHNEVKVTLNIENLSRP